MSRCSSVRNGGSCNEDQWCHSLKQLFLRSQELNEENQLLQHDCQDLKRKLAQLRETIVKLEASAHASDPDWRPNKELYDSVRFLESTTLPVAEQMSETHRDNCEAAIRAIGVVCHHCRMSPREDWWQLRRRMERDDESDYATNAENGNEDDTVSGEEEDNSDVEEGHTVKTCAYIRDV